MVVERLNQIEHDKTKVQSVSPVMTCGTHPHSQLCSSNHAGLAVLSGETGGRFGYQCFLLLSVTIRMAWPVLYFTFVVATPGAAGVLGSAKRLPNRVCYLARSISCAFRFAQKLLQLAEFARNFRYGF